MAAASAIWGLRVKADPIVADLDGKAGRIFKCRYGDRAAFRLPANAVLYGVFHHRLDREGRKHEAIGLQVVINLYTLTEAQLFYIKIIFNVAQFGFKRYKPIFI